MHIHVAIIHRAKVGDIAALMDEVCGEEDVAALALEPPSLSVIMVIITITPHHTKHININYMYITITIYTISCKIVIN